MRITLTVLALSSLLAACSADVSRDYNTAVNYSRYQTYTFSKEPQNDAISLDAARVQDAISTQLYSKGMKQVDSNADLTVRHAIVEQTDYRSYGTSLGFGYGYGLSHSHLGVAYTTPTQIREYRYGKLVVELIDNKSNQVVWRATSQRKLTETMTPSSRRSFIDGQINEMFKGYPPN